MDLRQVYYIGGSPCSGKSTIAERLAAEYAWPYYKLDDYLFTYMDLAAKDGMPNSAAQLAMDFEEMWMRDPQHQAEEELAVYEELWPYAMQAIRRMEGEAPIIAEGAGFLPALAAKHGIPKNRYICIVPTEAFQREMYAKRDWIGQYLSGCKDPDAAFHNWMSRDALFAKHVLRQADELGFQSIVVDGAHGIQDNLAIVKAVFSI